MRSVWLSTTLWPCYFSFNFHSIMISPHIRLLLELHGKCTHVHQGKVTHCCMYVSVRRVARRYGLREAMEGEDWTLFWTDCSVSLERVKDMKCSQVLHQTCSHQHVLPVSGCIFVGQQ